MTLATMPAHPGHLLVVDDDERNARLLARLLTVQGFAATVAGNGASALERIAELKPDLVLLDVMMPDLDGFEVCRRLRADPATADLPILLVTALSETSDKVRGLEAGADDFLTKPIDQAELLARVRTHLRSKRWRDHLAQAHESMERQNRRLLALERMQEDLMHMLVHDLKNPIGALKLTIDHLLCLDADGRQQRLDEALDTLAECADGIDHLVQDILDVARMEQARLELHLEPVRWPEVVGQALRPLAALARAEDKTVHSDLDRAGPCRADPALVGRVIQNLVANALRASEPGAAVQVEARDDGDAVLVTVADRGPGVPEEMRLAIFDKFKSVAARRTGGVVGHGLGLTFCRLGVEAHGGTIWVEPRPGGGSLFRFRLPAAPATESALGEPRLKVG